MNDYFSQSFQSLFIRDSLVAQMVKSLLVMQETQVWSLSQEEPLEKETATQSSILAWKIPWMEEPGQLQSWVAELDMTERLHFHFDSIILLFTLILLGFPGGSDDKASVYNARDPGSIPGSGRSPGEGNGNPLQCSCLENPMDRGAW